MTPHAVAAGPRTIALDGPVASGKSTVGRRVADTLGYLFFDTGILYRCLTTLALEAGVSVSDGPALAALVGKRDIAVQPAPGTARGYRVTAGGADLTSRLWTAAVDRSVSPVSAQPAVRAALLAPQRAVARQGPVVMAGRWPRSGPPRRPSWSTPTPAICPAWSPMSWRWSHAGPIN